MAASPTAAAALPPSQQPIFTAILGFWQSRAIAAAANLALADLLADGPLHIDSLSERTKTDGPTLFRLMRALESVGIFTQVSPRVFANTSVSNFLRTNVPGSLRSAVRSILSPGGGDYDAWAGFEHSLRTGEPAFDALYGYNYWEFLKRNPDKGTILNESQRAGSALSAPVVVAAYDWGRFSVIADIGGGTGTLLTAILDAHPSCRGILFDLPEVVAEAIPHGRAERVGGSFFESLPPGADAYLLKTVVHDWPDTQVMAILRKVREVIQPGGLLVLVESVIPDSAEFVFGKWGDLHMLALCGGRERTAAEFSELFGSGAIAFRNLRGLPGCIFAAGCQRHLSSAATRDTQTSHASSEFQHLGASGRKRSDAYRE